MKKILFLFCMMVPLITYGADYEGEFMVSGILQKKGSVGVVKLLHGIYKAGSESEARGLFVDAALNQYSEYSVLTILVSIVKEQCCKNENNKAQNFIFENVDNL